MNPNEPPSHALVTPAELHVTQPPLRARVEFGATTHTGKVRPNNEDQFFVARMSKTLVVLASSLPQDADAGPPDPEGYLMLVADGIGGAAAGERASALAVREARIHVLQTAKWFFALDDPAEDVRLQALHQSLERLDRRMVAEAQSDPSLTGMGTTLTAATIVGTDLFIVHVGDSRAYLLRQGHMEQLTHDHTLAQQMMDAGVLQAEEARTSRLRRVLTNAIGGQPGVRAEVHQRRLVDGDRLLLCTDGLTDGVPDSRIAELLGRHSPPDEACQALVEAALEAGGRDNITVVVAACAFGS